jgi:hypothetical protein
LGVFYGGEDKLTCKEDVERLLSELPEETVVYAQFEEEYGHLDFVWGDDAHIRFAPLLARARARAVVRCVRHLFF